MNNPIAGVPAARRLPSLDWIAFGLGVVAMFFHYVWATSLVVVGLAVFVPSLLREVGWLKDADEFTRSTARRAGFHALLAVAGLIFLNRLLVQTGLFRPQANWASQVPFTPQILENTVVWVFLFSYLLQYWGVHQGVTRILLGAALICAAPAPGFLRLGQPGWLGVGIILGVAVLMVALALLVRRRPRLGGAVLLGLAAVLTVLAILDSPEAQILWGRVWFVLQILLVFAIPGWALWRAFPAEGEME